MNESSPAENSTQRFIRNYRGLPWYDKASLALATLLGAGLFLLLSPLFLIGALFMRR